MSSPSVQDGVVFTLTYEDGTTADVVQTNEVTAERSKVHQVTLIGEDPYNGYEYVDLGLPSGLKWATCNVGAENSEEYGDYFAWGESEAKSQYRWSTYIFAYDTDPITGRLGDGLISKYLTKDTWGTPDDKTVLDPEDDAAYVNRGDAWRMPEYSDWEELRNNCTWSWTDSHNGTNVSGMIVTSNVAGYTDNSIFLPAQGIWDEGLRYRVSYEGYYWSSSLDQDHPTGAKRVWFDSDEFTMERNLERNIGAAVRPVSD